MLIQYVYIGNVFECNYLCFSHIYFLGDMNYRINPCDMNIREVASSADFKILLEYDQLTQQKKQKRIFHKFKEGDITFKPTFKYDVDSDEWDSRSAIDVLSVF